MLLKTSTRLFAAVPKRVTRLDTSWFPYGFEFARGLGGSRLPPEKTVIPVRRAVLSGTLAIFSKAKGGRIPGVYSDNNGADYGLLDFNSVVISRLAST